MAGLGGHGNGASVDPGGSGVVEGGAGTGVALVSDPVQFAVQDAPEIGLTLGKVLTQQPVGVLIRTPLSRLGVAPLVDAGSREERVAILAEDGVAAPDPTDVRVKMME